MALKNSDTTSVPNNTGHLALTAFIWQQTVFLSNHFFCSDVFGAPRSSLGAQPGFMCLTSLELIGFDELLSPTQIQSSLLPMYTNCSCLKNCLFSPCHDNRVYFFNVLLFISYCIRIAAPFFFSPCSHRVIMIYRRVHFVFSSKTLKSKYHCSTLSWFIGSPCILPSWSVKCI